MSKHDLVWYCLNCKVTEPAHHAFDFGDYKRCKICDEKVAYAVTEEVAARLFKTDVTKEIQAILKILRGEL